MTMSGRRVERAPNAVEMSSPSGTTSTGYSSVPRPSRTLWNARSSCPLQLTATRTARRSPSTSLEHPVSRSAPAAPRNALRLLGIVKSSNACRAGRDEQQCDRGEVGVGTDRQERSPGRQAGRVLQHYRSWVRAECPGHAGQPTTPWCDLVRIAVLDVLETTADHLDETLVPRSLCGDLMRGAMAVHHVAEDGQVGEQPAFSGYQPHRSALEHDRTGRRVLQPGQYVGQPATIGGLRYDDRALLTDIDPEPLRQPRNAFEQQTVHLVNPMSTEGRSADHRECRQKLLLHRLTA